MNPADFSTPPKGEIPLVVKYLMGLPQDASRQEVEREWGAQVVPLVNLGPQALFDREAEMLMAAGLTGPQARRVFKATKRGQMLADSSERDAKARVRAQQSKPGFLRTKH
jgi:hypothetical protein